MRMRKNSAVNHPRGVTEARKCTNAVILLCVGVWFFVFWTKGKERGIKRVLQLQYNRTSFWCFVYISSVNQEKKTQNQISTMSLEDDCMRCASWLPTVFVYSLLTWSYYAFVVVLTGKCVCGVCVCVCVW